MSSFAALATYTNMDTPAELYIPIHRRASVDMTASGSSTPSSRAPSPTQSHSSKASSSSSPMSLPTSLPSPSSPSLALPSSNLPIYRIDQLLYLYQSPLSTISPAAREHIRATVPEISMNRKQRKAREMREKPAAAPVSVSSPAPAPRAPLGPTHRSNSNPTSTTRDEMTMKRPNPTRRVPGNTQRRVHAVKTRGRFGLGDDASWRRTGSVQAIST